MLWVEKIWDVIFSRHWYSPVIKGITKSSAGAAPAMKGEKNSVQLGQIH